MGEHWNFITWSWCERQILHKVGNARAATMVYRFHNMAKQKPLHRKDRKLAGVLNMSAPFSLCSRRAAKRTMNGKMDKRTLYKTVHALKEMFMGVGIFLQDYWDQMCSPMHQALMMSRTPSLLLVALISLSEPGMQ